MTTSPSSPWASRGHTERLGHRARRGRAHAARPPAAERTRGLARTAARARGRCRTIHQVSSTPPLANLALPVTDETLAARLQQRLDTIEELLAGYVQGRTKYVSEAAAHLMSAGGKRFRPLLVLLAEPFLDEPFLEPFFDPFLALPPDVVP